MARPKKLTPEQAEENAKKSREKWNKEHKKQTYLYQKKSRAKGYIKNDAGRDELLELRGLIDERLKELENNNLE